MTSTPTDRRNRRWSRAVAAPLGAVVLVGLTACGTGTGPASGTGGSTSGTASAEAGAPSDTAASAYVSCLAQNGVTMPERPDGGTPPSGAGAPPADGGRGGGPGGPGAAGQAPPGVDADTWAAAQEACADLVPVAGSGT